MSSVARSSPYAGTWATHWLLFILCVTEYLPIALVSTTLPVVLRRGGASMDDIGLLTMAFFPWALKFLWAPLVDRFGSLQLGRYRSWLLLLVPVAGALVVVLGFVDLPQLLRESTSSALAILVALTVVCATIDTAAHGLAVVALPVAERGLANGVQTAGQMTGNLIGGGIAVISIGTLGWQNACFGLAALYVLPFFAVLRAKEPPQERRHSTLRLGDFLDVVRRPRMRLWLFWLTVFGLAYGLFGVPYQAALVDAGLDLTEIGLIQGVVMSLAGIAGGVCAGALMKRASRRTSFFFVAPAFAALLVPSVLAFTVLERARWSLYLGLSAAYFGVMAVSAVLYAMMMDRSRNDTASSDFTLQYSVLQVIGFIAWGLGAFAVERLGSAATVLLSLALTIVAVLIARVSFRPNDFEPAPSTETT